jgi:multicomponent Na+:H+ antiporter subunit E
MQPLLRPGRGPTPLGSGIRLAGIFFAELVKGSLRIARDVLSPKPKVRPGIVALPLDAETDLEITLLANLISLTPGTLSLDVSEDRTLLFVHALYADPDEADALCAHLKHTLERPVLQTLRSD